MQSYLVTGTFVVVLNEPCSRKIYKNLSMVKMLIIFDNSVIIFTLKFLNYLIYSNFDFLNWLEPMKCQFQRTHSPDAHVVRPVVRILNQGGLDQGPDQRPDIGSKSVSGCRFLI